MPTLNDIAQRAGVSTSSASRAFREGTSITPEVRERVLQAARELGYTPNLLARSLKSSRSNLIGVDVCNIENPFYALIIKSMENELKKHGYQLVLSYSNGDPKVERKNLELFVGMQAMGVVFMPLARKNMDTVRLLKKRGVALIQLFNRAYDFVDTISVLDDQGAYLAAKHILQHGHRQILLLNVDTPFSSDRADGYRRAFQELGIPLDERYIRTVNPANLSSQDVEALLTELAPTAVIAGVYDLGKKFLTACRALHYRVPEDISFVAFDDVEWPELMDITAVSQPMEYLGLTAVRMLLDRINGSIDMNQPVSTIVEPKLNLRSSVKTLRR
ncbi:MAG TPA: LacI family DNA-binding transcriptional regulator [Candidatus Avoscillospira avicola]|uniref:LacI family DNA-binding transcriptional regulator n=1 Tax=Candidatus Avoscillospira avicola TaxID=2840706 RepID=A0A9D1DGT1_9FIRM|nr:LacI family DNA-binding transcriptional regulator [Candidatus Avoscillospira avicola]